MARAKSLLIAGALSTAALIAPSTASADIGQCNNNYMCAWGNNDYKWLIAEIYHGLSGWADPFNAEENNETDSYANRSVTYTGCLADGADGSGDRVTMAKGDSDGNLASFNSDEASSMRTRGGC